MITSRSYNFQSEQTLDKLLSNACAMAGIDPAQISGFQTEVAIDLLNYNFIDLINRHMPLWAIDQQCFTIVPNSASYVTPKGTIDVVYNEAYMANFNRLLSGTANSSSGIANNAFDGNIATSCNQNAPNGWIEYNYGAGNQNAVKFIGILSAEEAELTIAVSYSNDGVNYYLYNKPAPLFYSPESTVWIVAPTAPPGQYIRIQETSGATLNISEVYFSAVTRKVTLGRISRQEITQQSFVSNTGIGSAFTVELGLETPIFTLWPTPSQNTTYTNVVYNRTRYIQDAKKLSQNIDAPQRYYSYMVLRLASNLAMLTDSPRLQMLEAKAASALNEVLRTDTEKVDVRVNLDIGGYLRF